MSLASAERIRDDTDRLFVALGVQKFFNLSVRGPYVDSLREDDPVAAGPPVTMTGAVTALSSGTNGEMKTVTLAEDLRQTLGALRPDQTVSIQEVDALGVSVPGGISGRIVGNPNESTELPMSDGAGYTVVHVERGTRNR